MGNGKAFLVTLSFSVALCVTLGCAQKNDGRALTKLCQISGSEFASVPLAGRIHLFEIDRVPVSVRNRLVLGHLPVRTLVLDFSFVSAKRCSISVYSEDTEIYRFSSDDSEVTINYTEVMRWDELMNNAAQHSDSGALWPYLVLTAHLFPVSHGLLFDCTAIQAIARVAGVRSSESFGLPADSVIGARRQGRGANSILGIILGDDRFAYRHEIVDSGVPYLSLLQEEVDGEVLTEALFSDPFVLRSDAKVFSYCKQMRMVSALLGEFYSEVHELNLVEE